ncbi:alpha-glucosidase [Candidatus Izemoplasma sp. B36]|uniref:alpha-glucosidase n=1 Tax=Candidatus Izemoplasma sp. B36 TaxID=3242468 RepID=UPI0035588F48
MKNAWWKSTTIYQITLSSFFDSNHDGVGDFLGVKEKLPYIKDLGIECIWVSPHYASPMDDNGYDVSDFYQTNPMFGTIDELKEMLDTAHALGMKVITDLVLNHTSDENEWFKIASDPSHKDFHKFHNYYIWQKPKYDDQGNRMRPTRWLSWFGGPTWDYVAAVDKYYLHIFSKKMPDLNWRNPDLRQAMKDVIKFWIDLGVDGFRVDAANHLEKNWDFPDGYPGYENFSSLPKHHEYIQNLAEEYFIPNGLLTIGESGGATEEQALKYVGFDSHEFNLLIHFGHVWADTTDIDPIAQGKWGKGKLRVSDIKKSFNHWYEMLKDKGWNLIYWHNHDHPRIVSHYGNDTTYRTESAKMLAIALYHMPGTSVTYQGEEIGMTNVLYTELEDFKDIEVFTEYDNFIKRGATHERAMQILRDRCRDNSRSPMQWTNGPNSGFSDVNPFMKVNLNYKDINVQLEEKRPNSILDTYRFLLKNRKIDSENIIFGNIKFIDIDNQDNFIYMNTGINKEYLVICNFRAYQIDVSLKEINIANYKYFYGNLEPRELCETLKLRPFEALVYIKNI